MGNFQQNDRNLGQDSMNPGNGPWWITILSTSWRKLSRLATLQSCLQSSSDVIMQAIPWPAWAVVVGRSLWLTQLAVVPDAFSVDEDV